MREARPGSWSCLAPSRDPFEVEGLRSESLRVPRRAVAGVPPRGSDAVGDTESGNHRRHAAGDSDGKPAFDACGAAAGKFVLANACRVSV